MSSTGSGAPDYSFEKRWGGAAVAQSGFTLLPNHLIAINAYLPAEKKLTPTEFMVLVLILASWWSNNRLPFPSKDFIGRRAGISSRQVQRAIGGLEKKGFLRRIGRYAVGKGRSSNSYDLSGAVDLVQRHAEQVPNIFKQSYQGDEDTSSEKIAKS